MSTLQMKMMTMIWARRRAGGTNSLLGGSNSWMGRVVRVSARIRGSWFVLFLLPPPTRPLIALIFQFLEFVRSIDSKLEKYDMEGQFLTILTCIV